MVPERRSGNKINRYPTINVLTAPLATDGSFVSPADQHRHELWQAEVKANRDPAIIVIFTRDLRQVKVDVKLKNANREPTIRTLQTWFDQAIQRWNDAGSPIVQDPLRFTRRYHLRFGN